MNNSVQVIRNFMCEHNISYLLVNSTNKYLVEYCPLEENSRYILTGFSGSTGDALVTPKEIYLFVDGRYHIQADLEVDKNIISVVKLRSGQSFLDELIKKIPENEVLGVFSKKNSKKRVEYLTQKGIKLRFFDNDPLDRNIKYATTNYTKVEGLPVKEKIKDINKTILLTNLEEVSYLFNLRDFSKNYSSKINGKAVIVGGQAIMLDEIDDFAKNFDSEIWVDKSTINAYDYNLLGDRVRILADSPIKLMKSIKTQKEIEHYKSAFNRTDMAVRAIRDYIANNNNISEYDISEQLEKEFRKYGAKNLSFKSIVAKDKNSALAHYSKCSKEEVIKDGSLVLIDCGAYYEQGLATDITRVFVKGNPTKLQKQVYTTVLKMFLNSYNYLKIKKTDRVCGYDIDNFAREIYSKNLIDNFVFNHGLGHGIGINVHEYPPNLSNNEMAKVEIKDGMCFTIEPGLYNENHFGVRLENSCYMQDGKIRSFTHMNYEKKLIDFSMLCEQEKEWLKEFEVL